MKRLVLTGVSLAALSLAVVQAKDDYRSLSRTWDDVRAQLERRRGDREKALKTLAEVAPKLLKADQRKAVKLFLDKGLDSRSAVVVQSSLAMLEQVDDKRAVKQVIKAFERSKQLGRTQRLAKVLAALPSNDVHRPLVKALKDSEVWVRVAAAKALGERGTKAKGEAKRPLERMAKRDDSLLVRAVAADALELVGGDRPKDLPPAKVDADGLPDRFYADRVAFLLDATRVAAKEAYQDPFAEDDAKKEGDEEKKKESKPKPVKPRSPYQLMTQQVLAAVSKRLDRKTTRFTAARFGGQVAFYEREFVKPNRRGLSGFETWTRSGAGRDQNRDVARAIRTLLNLDPAPQVIYVFLTGPSSVRGRQDVDAAIDEIEELLAKTPARIHVTWFGIPPEREPTSELGKAKLRERQRAYAKFVGGLAKAGGGAATQVDLATAAADAKPDDTGSKKDELGIDLTKALSRRDTSRLKKALRIRKGQSDLQPAADLVEQLGACPDARRATPLALDELRGTDPLLADAALAGLQRNADAKVHAELLKELKGERDPVARVRLVWACAKHPGVGITSALIEMTGNTKQRDLDRIVWKVLSERPPAELTNVKSKLARKARGAPRGLATFYANTAVAKAAGRQPPSSSGLEVGPDRFLPARFNAKGVAFVVDTNHSMKEIFWRPLPVAPVKKKDDEEEKTKKRRRRRRSKKDEPPAKKQPDPVSALEASSKEIERALRVAEKGSVAANVLVTGGRSWKSSCSPLGRGALKEAIDWLQRLRTGGQRDVWTGLQRALNDPSCEQIHLLVSGLPIRSPGSDEAAELHRKVRELNETRGVAIHVVYVLPPVAPDEERLAASRRDLLAAMDKLYKPLATASGGTVVIRHKLVGLGQPPKPSK